MSILAYKAEVKKIVREERWKLICIYYGCYYDLLMPLDKLNEILDDEEERIREYYMDNYERIIGEYNDYQFYASFARLQSRC